MLGVRREGIAEAAGNYCAPVLFATAVATLQCLTGPDLRPTRANARRGQEGMSRLLSDVQYRQNISTVVR